MKLALPLQNFVGLLRYAVIFQVLYFLSIPIILKYYDSESYGLYAVIFAISSVIGSLGPLRLERALVVEDSKYASYIIWRCIASSLIAAVFVTTLGILVLPSVTAPGDTVVPLAIIAGLYSLVLSAIQILAHLAIKQEKVILTGVSDALYAALLIAGLFLFEIDQLNQTIQLFLIFFFARGLSLAPYLRLQFADHLHSKARPEPRALKKYYIPVLTALLANTQFRGMFFLTSAFYGNAVTGNLSMAHRIMYAPVNLLGGSLRRAFFLEFTKNNGQGKVLHKYINTVWRYGGIATTLIFPIFVLIAHFSRASLPQGWQSLPLYGLAIYPAISMIVLLSWLDRLYDVHGKQNRALYYEVAYTTLLYGALFFGVILSVSPIVLLLIYSVVTTFYNILWARISLRMIDMQTKQLSYLTASHCAMLLAVAYYFYFAGSLKL